MKVIYRMCGIPSTNPSPWSQDDKYHLNKICLKSFVEAFRGVKLDIHFLMDYCGKEYSKMVEDIPFDYEVEFSETGINDTMIRSYEIAEKIDDIVLFQECDYLYRPGVGKLFERVLGQLPIVSPYDHKNFYIDNTIHSPNCEIKLVEGYHFRSTERNTMTWGCHSSIIKENIDTLEKYGYLDNEVWRDLEYAGHRLYVPIPSFATHCVKDYLSPGIDWEARWQELQ